MSQENVEFGRAEASTPSQRDVEEVLSSVHPEGELHSRSLAALRERVRGHDGVRRWYVESMESFEELSDELTESAIWGIASSLSATCHARGRGSGLEVDSPTGWVLTVRRGKVVRGEAS